MSDRTEPVRLVLVDSQTIVREALRALIDREGDLVVVAQAVNLRAAERLTVQPHVVVTDIDLPDGESNQVIAGLRDRFSHAGIVAFTSVEDPTTVRQAVAAGANGYVLRSAAKEDLLAAIRSTARGRPYLQPSIGMVVAAQPTNPETRRPVGELTPTETEVLRLISFGHTNLEIARRLHASLRTIETHRAHILQKLNRHSRAELVRFALDSGLLRTDGLKTSWT